MSVRSFHSVFMATIVAGAALGCYLVSLRVASERSALEEVESRIIATQSDIRLLQTEIGTRARLAQLERWNVRVLALSAPTADQILGDKFQLARLIAPQPRPALEAPVVLAAATASPRDEPLAEEAVAEAEPASDLLHQASLKTAPAEPPKAERPRAEPPKPVVASKNVKKAGEKTARPAAAAVTRPVRTATVDPLAPLPAAQPTAKGSRTAR